MQKLNSWHLTLVYLVYNVQLCTVFATWKIILCSNQSESELFDRTLDLQVHLTHYGLRTLNEW